MEGLAYLGPIVMKAMKWQKDRSWTTTNSTMRKGTPPRPRWRCNQWEGATSTTWRPTWNRTRRRTVLSTRAILDERSEADQGSDQGWKDFEGWSPRWSRLFAGWRGDNKETRRDQWSRSWGTIQDLPLLTEGWTTQTWFTTISTRIYSLSGRDDLCSTIRDQWVQLMDPWTLRF